MKTLFKLFIVLMPWKIKRFLLMKFFKFKLHKTAKIGLAWIYPAHLEMAENSIIDHFNVAIHLDTIRIGHHSMICRSNWITGTSANRESKFFNHQTDRKAELLIGNHSNITKNHHLDCTNTLYVGHFVTIAGYSSQFLTHSINIIENRQDSAPISIGDYTFVGTNSVVLGGAVLPARSVLGAKSLLNKAYEKEWMLYGGVPAKPVMEIDKNAKYFNREDGFVY